MNNNDDSINIHRDYDSNDTYFFNFNDSALIHDYGGTTSFIRGSSSLLLRAGLILIQFGSIPSINSNSVILQNVIDLSFATIAYGTLGLMFSFGKDKGGVIGWGGWILTVETNLNNAILGWSTIVTATGIYTTMFSGRLHYCGSILITTLLAGVVIPIVMHWIWSSTGWMHKATFVQNIVSYKDHGGGLLIHVCGGAVALIGSLFLGRRLLRLQDIDDAFLPAGSPASATIGYFLVIIGLMGICLPTPMFELTHEPMNYIGLIFLNNILAATAGVITVAVIQFIVSRQLILHYWSVLKYLQGAVAGIVTIASGVDVYTPYVSLGLGVAGAILFYIIAYYLFYTSLEDYANVIAIHLICGFLSTLLPPLCGNREGFGAPNKMIIHFAWQVIADLAILAVLIAFTVILFFIMNIFQFLRNKEEEKSHERAVLVRGRSPPRTCCQRLWRLRPEPHLLQPGCRANKESYQQTLSISSPDDSKAIPGEEHPAIYPSSSTEFPTNPNKSISVNSDEIKHSKKDLIGIFSKRKTSDKNTRSTLASTKDANP